CPYTTRFRSDAAALRSSGARYWTPLQGTRLCLRTAGQLPSGVHLTPFSVAADPGTPLPADGLQMTQGRSHHAVAIAPDSARGKRGCQAPASGTAPRVMAALMRPLRSSYLTSAASRARKGPIGLSRLHPNNTP